MPTRFIYPALVVVFAVSPSLIVSLVGQSTGIRQVSASSNSLIPLQTRIRWTTTIELPDEEVIVRVICGDQDYWVVDTTENLAHVKPAKEGASTDLKLLTIRGTKYVFLLSEKKEVGLPDVWVRVASDPNAASARQKYFTSEQMETVQSELAEARAASDAAEQRSAEAIATYQQQYPIRLQFVYGPLKYEKPFLIRAMWHDGQFTYVRSDATELPALYELKDGKPAAVNFQVQDRGTYVVSKVLDRGYFSLGDARWSFAQGR